MRFIRIVSASFVCLSFSTTLSTTLFSRPQTNAQATSVIQKALAALSGTQAITDVILTGNAHRIAGSDDETGDVVIKAASDGSSKITLGLPAGSRIEVRTNLTSGPAGQWSGPDGVVHSMAGHNLSTDPGWVPAFIFARLNSAPGTVLKYVGQETRNESSVLHLSASRQFALSNVDAATLLQHLSQTEIFLDASTFLPVAITFNTHPDDTAPITVLAFVAQRPGTIQAPQRNRSSLLMVPAIQ